MSSTAKDKQLSMRGAVRVSGWHRATIHRAIRRKRLPATYTPGGHVRILESDLRKLMSEPPSR